MTRNNTPRLIRTPIIIGIPPIIMTGTPTAGPNGVTESMAQIIGIATAFDTIVGSVVPKNIRPNKSTPNGEVEAKELPQSSPLRIVAVVASGRRSAC